MRSRLVYPLLAWIIVAGIGCGPSVIQVGLEAPTATRPAVAAQPTEQPATREPTARPLPPTTATTSPRASATPAPTATTADTDAAIQTVVDYFRAINDRDLGRAYRMWSGDGAASGQTLDQFTQGFARTVQVDARIGAPAGGAGSITLPVTLVAIANPDEPAKDQIVQHYEGTCTLRPVEGSWRITGADLTQVPGDGNPPADSRDPATLLNAYVDAINRRDLGRAYTYWNHIGQNSQQTFAQFRQGFATTAQVAIQLGEVQMQGAAGSTYAEVPALIDAHQADGSTRTYCGTYTLRRLNVPPFDQLGWHIEQAAMAPVAAVQLGSEQAAHMLQNGCRP